MKLVPKKENQAKDNKKKTKKGTDAIQPKNKAGGGWKEKFNSAIESLPKDFNPSRSVGIRLFLIFFIAIMSFVLAIGILSYTMAKNTIEKNAETASQQTIVQTSQKLDIIFQKYEETLQQVFLDDEMQKAIRDASLTTTSDYDRFTTSNQMRNRLNSMTFSSKGVVAVYMVPGEEDLIGPVTSGSADNNFINNIRSESWFEDMANTSQVKWITASNENASGTQIFRLVRSVQSVSSMKRFILVADINLEILNGYLQELNLGNGSKVQMLTADNMIVGSSVEGENGQQSEFTIQKKEDGAPGSTRIKNAQGRTVLAVYNTQQNSGWTLMGVLPTDQLTKDARGILVTTFVSLAVVAVIAILIGMWIVRMIGRPLVALKNLMEEGAKGNLNVRMKPKSKDEIGMLTASFNVMMEQITQLVKQTNNSAQDVLDTAAELTQASNKTAISAKEIAIATEEIANGATSLANEAERGNELTENISRQMEHVISANKEMETSARQVERSSQQGTEYLNELLQKTSVTGEMVNALTEKVEALKSSTSSVMKVLDVMQNITQQTNILSLNATIEAARAGAAGRGFMVVADEIRQLADQSRQSITMVGEITDNIQKEMNETVEALSEASPLFQDQIKSVKETSQIFVSVQEQMEGFVQHLDSVTASIDELNQSQSVLSEAMSNVSAVAQQSSATSEEVASLSSEQQNVGDQLVNLSSKLENVSNGLKESLSKFTV
ncbi:methyl-accepting chemotaxis protein [Paenibacillus woosongensis]|uniref:HAMP domain-containing protein n=1 Tax=Paenibacillus woosongensis TaxID=307580 RepID=A0A7X3CNW4_9BACL|nr:methyl-accepting chemotaxis protein [Paenibacillus woosongensis]MUG45405.1 HAMP domain-containing protein [Paenibacillus woosongensis]